MSAHAGLGLNVLKSFQASAKLANEQSWAGAVKFEVVPFDNRLSAQRALSQLNSIIGQNIRYKRCRVPAPRPWAVLQEAIESTSS